MSKLFKNITKITLSTLVLVTPLMQVGAYTYTKPSSFATVEGNSYLIGNCLFDGNRDGMPTKDIMFCAKTITPATDSSAMVILYKNSNGVWKDMTNGTVVSNPTDFPTGGIATINGVAENNYKTFIEAEKVLDSVDAILAAYVAVGGDTNSTLYTAVTTAKAALIAAMDTIYATENAKASAVSSATATLAEELEDLETDGTDGAGAGATVTLAAQGVSEKADALAAQAAYLAAGGKNTDTVYTTVSTALAELNTALAARPRVVATVEAKISALTTATGALTSDDAGLGSGVIAAVLAAQNKIAEANARMSAYISTIIGGKTTDPIYIATSNKIDELNIELNKTTKDATAIGTATTNLDGTFSDLESAITDVTTEIQGTYTSSAVGGSSGDEVYTEVDPTNFETIVAKLTALQNAIDEKLATALATAKAAANVVIGEVPGTLSLFLAQGGKTDDAAGKYAAVVTAKNNLQLVLNDNTKGVGDINTYNCGTADCSSVTGGLKGAINTLNAASYTLVDAKLTALVTTTSPSTENKNLLTYTQDTYNAIVGNRTDSIYIATVNANTKASNAKTAAATPNVTNVTEFATSVANLDSAIKALDSATLSTIIAKAEVTKTLVNPAKTLYATSGGNTETTPYTTATTALNELNDALNAVEKSASQIKSKNDALNSAVESLITTAKNNTSSPLMSNYVTYYDAANGSGAINQIVYKNVDNANTALTTANKTVALINDLNNKLVTLVNTTNTLVTTNANTELNKVSAAQSAYIDAGGSALNAKYTAVTTAKTQLEDALTATPRNNVDIADKTGALKLALSGSSGLIQATNKLLVDFEATKYVVAVKLVAGQSTGTDVTSQVKKLAGANTANSNITVTITTDTASLVMSGTKVVLKDEDNSASVVTLTFKLGSDDTLATATATVNVTFE